MDNATGQEKAIAPLDEDQLACMASRNNWAAVMYQDSGLVRNMTSTDPDADGWEPVTDCQTTEEKREAAAAKMQVITLEHGQQIRTTMDRYQPRLSVYSVEGCARDWEEDPAANFDRAMRLSHPVAWVMLHSVSLEDDYPGKGAAADKARDEYNAAILINNGDTVKIEGRLYSVKYVGIRYADPVHLVPVKK